jgi:glycosyltransferase involved in cell wall biosynthesis
MPVGLAGGEGWLSDRLRASGFERGVFTLERPIDFRGLLQLRRILASARVDIVHSHEFTMAVYGCAAARSLGLRHVITMHGDQGVTAALRRRVALRWAFRNSAAVVAVSNDSRRAMAERLGIAPTEMQVVHNGVVPKRGSRSPVRRELGLVETAPMVLAVGSLRPNKGHHVLLEALSGLERENWFVCIAGQGPERDKLMQLARELGIGSRTRLLGQRADVANVQAAADIFVMPSFSEGLPLALLEAMFAGSPIVASRTGGMPEAVRDGREGILVAPGNVGELRAALAKLLRDPSLRQRLGAAARNRAMEHFSLQRMANCYEALYRAAEPSA